MLLHPRLLRLALLAWPWLVATAIVGTVAALCQAASVLALGLVAHRLLTGGNPGGPAVFVAVAGVVALVLSALRALLGAHTGSLVRQRTRRLLVERLAVLGPGWRATSRPGSVAATLGDGVESLPAYVGSYLPQLVVAAVVPAAFAVGAWAVDPVVGMVLTVALILTPSIKPLWQRLAGDRSRAHWLAYRTLHSTFLESLRGMTTLKLLGATAARARQVAGDAAALYVATRRQMGVALLAYRLAALVIGVGSAGTVLVATIRVLEGHLDEAWLVVLLVGVAECFRPLQRLESSWLAGFRGYSSADGIVEILDAVAPVRVWGEVARSPQPPTIEFADVRFAYPGASRPALDGFTLRVEAGTTVALVGRSGAGKSTAAALLMRWFDPDAGQITLDGTPLGEFDRDSHRRHLAHVSQRVHLVDGSVADNIRLAVAGAPLSAVREAAVAAQADDFIRRLPQGYQTPVGERGAGLSGGERQRIALARALLMDAPLLILDEATAHLDGANEAALLRALDRARAGRTTLIVAHRLSAISRVDRVAVLDEGRLVRHGTPEQVLPDHLPWDLLTGTGADR